jgi:glycosyltransferase involved in cell wall biosynthesis
VSLIVPCRNEARSIEGCLRSVLAFDEPAGGFEVVVVDGMSEDGTRQIVERVAGEDRRVRVLDNLGRKTPRALNIGICAARGAIVIRIDAHTEYAPDYVCQCLAVMAETGADNVGGPARTRATGTMHRAISAAYHSRFAVGGAAFHQEDFEGYTDTVPYGCFHKQRLIEIGLFDEDLDRNQDDELNLRLCRSGGRIWQSPRIRSWYTPRDNLYDLCRQYGQYGYWKVLVLRKHRIPAATRHLVPGSFVGVLVLLALLAPLVPAARGALAALVALYSLALLAASGLTASRTEWRLLPVLPAVFASYHLPYGVGFLLGTWDFLVRGRAKGRLGALTRRSLTRG